MSTYLANVGVTVDSGTTKVRWRVKRKPSRWAGVVLTVLENGCEWFGHPRACGIFNRHGGMPDGWYRFVRRLYDATSEWEPWR